MAAYNDIAEALKYIVKVANSRSSNIQTLLHMNEYINLDRRFGLSTKFDSMLEFEGLGKRLTWDELLEGRLSLIKARANFGKSVELEACAKRLRKEREFAVFVALRRLLGQDDFATALGPEDEQAYSSWRVATGEHLYLFVDSLDEAALGHEEGLQVALRRVTRAVNWPNLNVTWVLSSRPATLTPEVLELLQTELRTTLYTGKTPKSDETADDAREVFTERKQTEQPELANAGAIGRDGAAASSAEATTHKVDPLKVYDLLPLDNSAARLYLRGRHNVADPKEMLAAARRFGLGGLTAGPGSLDVLVFADLVGNPPDNLTDAFDRMVRGVHAQERADRRERQVGNPSPESLATAVEKLASASVVCQLPNIELSQEALEFREGVLSSRPVVGALLAQDSLNYLLSSRLFIDSGHHQVKVYPDELLPYLAAKRLAARVQSPDDAARLLSNFTWSASTGECGVHRVYLPLAGWLSTLSSHCRHELMTIEPQAVAFFGDLRSPQTSLAEAAEALTAAIERLVNVGDVLGRRHYTLTIENFWQVGKPGIADTLRLLFERHADDWRARDTLLDIATYVRLDLFREGVMKTHGWSYASLLKNHDDLHYIMSLERDDDGTALAQALVAAPDVAEQVASTLLTRLAWKWLDAREMAEVAARQFLRGRGAFHIDWALTREVADEAEPYNLYALTRSLLVRVGRSLRAERLDGGGRRQGHEFVELVMDMLALAIERSAYSPLRLSRLCLVLHRLVRDFHQGTADRQKLRSALEKATDVRRLFLRGLIEGTDRSSDSIWRSVFLYGTLSSGSTATIRR